MRENPSNDLVFVAIGGNLPAEGRDGLRPTLEAGVAALSEIGCTIIGRSSWWCSPAWPPPGPGESRQPDYLNAVVALHTDLAPDELLLALHGIEAAFGRNRLGRWDARPLDLDLIDYAGRVQMDGEAGRAILPHPRMAGRLFVLLPLRELAPDWRHPRSGLAIEHLIAAAEPMQINRLGGVSS